MLVFGTQMHIVTFIFVSIEIVIFFYLLIYKLARPDDKIAFLNIILIFLLITYNITGGLLPDPNMPGSFFTQEVIAYATGFITPCYFPYYVYKAFGLEKMKFHAYRGVFLFLVIPYIIFIVVFAIANSLQTAQNVLILPVLYALWVIFTLVKAIKYKYGSLLTSKESKEEVAVLFLSLTPWVGLPIIDYFELGQVVEASVTNTGFLLLLALQVSRHIKQTRTEHQRLIESERQLLNWNTSLQNEVDKRTKELEKANEQKTNNFINLVHETKTPLTLVNNYLEEYINKYGSVEELEIIKGGVDKLTRDVISLFDIERFTKGIDVYNHNQVTNFTEIIKSSLVLFEYYCKKQIISCHKNIEENVFIKADPNAIDRIVNNVIENAIKFSNNEGKIEISLGTVGDKIHFSVKDAGIGIPPDLQKKIFEPYYQINHKKTGLQGMGLGLPIVKKVVDSLGGQVHIKSNPAEAPGTEVTIILNKYVPAENEFPAANPLESKFRIPNTERFEIADTPFLSNRPSILLIEDNKAMLHFLSKKLSGKYNIFCSLNGAEALKKLHELPVVPDLILSDIMMDKMDGFAFAKVISEQDEYNHIPIIFLTAKSTPTDKLKGLRLGAIDFIPKPFSFEELNQKIDTVLKNIGKQKKAILNLSIANLKNLGNVKAVPEDVKLSFNLEQKCKSYNLTNREIEIVKLVLKGTKYKEIAKTLFIADKTVATHIQNIFEKIGVSNKVEMINKLSDKE
ncbi:MAG: response regulator [Sediminibacterium magnilacihabitans]|jgi:signal transduction histidine kinase/DNA-binding NarL/FixJ family response regulator|nr:response regulator [Sediminibacterium magnilacihabitans]PQV61542.1 signal transduction histidine kinase [Sediminibacterium magnilacihabitans]